MDNRYDLALIGGGPAAYAAAISAAARGKTSVIITNPPENSRLWKAEKVDNYPGLPDVTGAELITALKDHAEKCGAVTLIGRATSIMPTDKSFFVSFGQEFIEAGAVILTFGLQRKPPLEGEMEFLGRGVSCCATCDGMLYRGKRVVVWGDAHDRAEEAEFLRSIGCIVTESDAKKLAIHGGETVTGVTADGKEIECDGVFLLRTAVAPDAMLRGLELTADRHIAVTRKMETNIPGVYAAGDCTGAPYQIAKAVGEGQVAAINAADYIDKVGKDG